MESTANILALHLCEARLNAMIFTKEAVSELAEKTLRCPEGVQWSHAKVDSKCRSFFGAPPHVIADLWNTLQPDLIEEEKEFYFKATY
jgi:hypothetical protein